MSFEFIHAIPVASLIVTDTDELVVGNAALYDIFPNLQVGRSFWSILRHANLGGLLTDARQGRGPAKAEVTLRTPTRVTFEATVSKAGDNHVLICLQDINETATAVQMRKDFIADLSHELRSPLTAIQGILETAKDDPDALQHFLPTLSDQTLRMNGLVSELLTLSRIQNNERRRPKDKVSLQNIIETACAPLVPTIKKNGVELEIDMPEKPVTFQGDTSELVRAVANLVENAIRYGADGKRITVRAAVEDSDARAKSTTVVIEVLDQGPGVEHHHLPRLTERFYRTEPHRARAFGGNGLGLAIVKHIVSRHRGRLEFSNRAEGGFRARMELPAA